MAKGGSGGRTSPAARIRFAGGEAWAGGGDGDDARVLPQSAASEACCAGGD